MSTTNKWSKHATDALVGQQITTTKIGIEEFAASGIDWSAYSLAKPDELELVETKQLRPHQVEALVDVQQGFEEATRGKLHHGVRYRQDVH